MSELMKAAVNAPLLVAEKKLEKAESQLRQAEAQITHLHDHATILRETLSWYAEKAAGCRLIHSEGDANRHDLQADGGARARDALEVTK